MKKKDNMKIDVVSNIDEKIIDEATDMKIDLTKKAEKREKKKIIVFLSSAASFCIIFSVIFAILWPIITNDPSVGPVPSGTIPVYQGMTVRRLTSTDDTAEKEGSFSLVRAGAYDNGGFYSPGNNKWHGSKPENDIEDITSVDVTVDPEIKYYVYPKEKFIIEVHIDNPDNFEIQSFTLNGEKYANYMFKTGSTMELLLLEVTAPEKSGYAEYTIDAIKYIDGTEIKDVDMSGGDKSIKVGVIYNELPTATIVSEKISPTSIELSVDVKDVNSLIGKNELLICLSDGENVVYSKPLSLGENKVLFENLNVLRTYEYGVVTAYDKAGGNNTEQYWLVKNEVTTASAFNVGNVVTTNEAVTFEVTKAGEKGSITSVSLYDAKTNSLVQTASAVTRAFEGLKSEHAYNLRIDFTYKINGEEVSDWIVINDIVTKAKSKPEVTIAGLSADQASVSYSLAKTDADGILKIDKVDLLRGGEIVKTNSGELSGSFAGLLSDNDYAVRVSYSYDLNDGKGIISETVTKEIQTNAKSKPEVTIAGLSADQVSVSYSLAKTDADGILKIDKVDLLRGGEIVKTNSGELSGSFAGLLSDNDYVVRVSYSYDLNDGKGIISETVTKEIQTNAKSKPEVTIAGLSADQVSVSYSLVKKDENSGLKIDKVDLLRGGEVVKTNSGELSGSFAGLLSDNDYAVLVSYSYDLNDGKGLISETVTSDIKTKAKIKLSYTFNATCELVPAPGSGSRMVVMCYAMPEGEQSENSATFISCKCELINDGEIIGTKNFENPWPGNFSFSKIAPHTEFTARFTYTYDMNDGKGVVEETMTETVTTGGLIYSYCFLDGRSLKYKFELLEEEETFLALYEGEKFKIEIFKGEELVTTENVSFSEELYFTVKDFLPNTTYTAKITYTYDFGDGNGPVEDVYTKDYTTNALKKPTVTVSDENTAGTTISRYINANDSYEVILAAYEGNCFKVELFKGEELVSTQNVSTGIFKIGDLLPSTTYTLKVTYSYDLYDGNGVVAETVTKTVTTTA